MTTPYPTISISLSSERTARLNKILRMLRANEENENLSRSEAVGRAIDAFYLSACPAEETDVRSNEPVAANN